MYVRTAHGLLLYVGGPIGLVQVQLEDKSTVVQIVQTKAFQEVDFGVNGSELKFSGLITTLTWCSSYNVFKIPRLRILPEIL